MSVNSASRSPEFPGASSSRAEAKPLPPVAARIDLFLAKMDGEIDWLTALSPIHNDGLWDHFQDSGRKSVPALEYLDPAVDLQKARASLHALPMEDIESPLLEGLLREKQRELDRQIELILMRGTDGFVNASIDLFGGIEPRLKTLALEILSSVKCGPPLEDDAGIDEVVAAAEADLAWYRERRPGLESRVIVEPDLGSLLVVSQGDLHIAKDIRIPRARVQPLIQHEIGTHVVTRHNGRRQALRQLEVGLPHYDSLQEGLGVLAEYLCGFLPAERLRVLAARVIATDMAIHDQDVPEIFHCLHQDHGLPTDDAFDVAVRSRRGGGLTKDAVYLSGLRDLLDHLGGGGAFEPMFVGKFALSHLVVMDKLIEEGWVVPPDLLPRYLQNDAVDDRLALCRSMSVAKLFQQEPCA